MTDFYEVLGVHESASTEEIRKAYRIKAKIYHPDLNPLGGEAAQLKFKELSQAHEVLKDPFKRAQYDHSRSTSALRETARRMTMDDFMDRYSEYWSRSAYRPPTDAERMRSAEEKERLRQARALSWEQEKREAITRKVAFSARRARAHENRHRRINQTLRDFWQARTSVMRQDLIFMVGIGLAMAGSASYWRLYLSARPSELETRAEENARPCKGREGKGREGYIE
uniref:Chaperone protein n=2 Tax=Tetraselmis sp. GSL018 TaxID=582737 RepID=A0A061S6Z9_9CHLO|eukprot:CAMPEP_0177601430 /NCGR_PEP_ID=MMETSP0419_2-20121207/14254_1 /TAXON_ID=582737 /ORGANISM="Tetraselmis sp., Strain GSL018" /LENGTH=225 /DNA_ID=CAMNT_0019094693 /DNA_START=360 /DNA_END=1037 /DNA_ORIENTATION=-